MPQWACITLSRGTLLCADVAAVLFSTAAATQLWSLLKAPAPFLLEELGLAAALVPFIYAIQGLYGYGVTGADELRRLSLGTSAMFLILAAAVFLTKQVGTHSRGVFACAWLLALFIVPFCRGLVRAAFSHKTWWSLPVVVVGANRNSAMVIRRLNLQPALGLRPVCCIQDDLPAVSDCEGVPVVNWSDLIDYSARNRSVRHAILALPAPGNRNVPEVVATLSPIFPHLFLVPDLCGLGSLWVNAKDLNGLLALEFEERLLSSTAQLIKRCMDPLLIIATAPVVAPLVLTIAALIRVTSSGPVFYGHTRVGRDGRKFTVWKFRTMIPNADAALQQYLAANPSAAEEWARQHKLKHDPRLTRLGRLLRRSSLDELPQLWNVLIGEMSLVGPRPIVEAEIEKYGSAFDYYKRVRPGLTGLWQISGRNNTSYGERVAMDSYYVRNWSLWLDLYILSQTLRAVLSGKGAY